MISNKTSKAEQINQVLLDTSRAVKNTASLISLYKDVREILGNIIDVSNFYVALFDSRTNTVRFPFYIDTRNEYYNLDGTNGLENIIEYSLNLTKGSLTAMVIDSGKPLLITKQELLDHCRKEKCVPSGTPPEVWMGVPLKTGEQVLGVIAVQSYTDIARFNEEDIGIFSLVCEQVATAVERISCEQPSVDSESRYVNLVTSIKEIIYSTDATGAFTYISPLAESLLGYSYADVTGRQGWYRFLPVEDQRPDPPRLFSDLIHPADRLQVKTRIHDSRLNRTSFQVEYRIRTGRRKERWVLEKGRFYVTGEDEIKLDGIILDIHDRKRAELTNQTFYKIADAVKSSSNLDDLYQIIYDSLNRIINARNFYIAIYDKANDSVAFPFDIDEMEHDRIDVINSISQSTALTGEVIRTGKPVMVTRHEAEALVEKYGKEPIGTPAELWLGAPLIVQDEVIGVMTTQSYTESDFYDDKDVETFLSVSDQVAAAIDRKRHEEELLRKKLELRTLYEISNAINTTFNTDELYESIHQSLQRIIDVRNMGIALYDANADTIEYPYLVDEKLGNGPFTIPNASKSSSLAYDVVSRGKPAILGRDEIDRFIKSKGGQRIGYPSKSWLGFPLKGKDKILGAIVVQNYDEPNRFKQKEIDLLESVSGQIAFAIERKQAEVDLATIQRELIEYAHKVGMADIANATLHNVGNILNSVKTSTEQIHIINKDSDFRNFQQANNLLRQRMNLLEAGIGDRKMALKLVEYYDQLEEQFENEKKQIQKQVERLNSKISLMTDVITTQQNFTNASFMTGDYPLEEIVEDVLTMQADMLHRCKITVEKRFAKIPTVRVQRTKLVHVLINLMNNAKDAMIDTPADQKKLQISFKKIDENVLLSIRDTGAGIVDEEFSRIFTHGYTTKKSGHGFGLHNSAIYLEEMNGQIWAESEGPGKGAVFHVTLPVASGRSSGSAGRIK